MTDADWFFGYCTLIWCVFAVIAMKEACRLYDNDDLTLGFVGRSALVWFVMPALIPVAVVLIIYHAIQQL